MTQKNIEYSANDISSRGTTELDFKHVKYDPELIGAATDASAANLLKHVDTFLSRVDVRECLMDRQANLNANELIVGTAAQLYRLLDAAGWKDISTNGINGRLLLDARTRSEKLRLVRDDGRTLVTEELPIEHHRSLITFENTRKGYLTNAAETLRIYFVVLVREAMMLYRGVLDPAVQPADNIGGHKVTIGQPPLSISDMLMLGVQYRVSRKNKIEYEKMKRGWENGGTEEETEIEAAYRKRDVVDPKRRRDRIQGQANALLWRGGRLAQRADEMIERKLHEISQSTTRDVQNITRIGLLTELVGNGDLAAYRNQPRFFSNPHHASSDMQKHFRQPQLTLGHPPARRDEQICFDDKTPMKEQIEAAMESIERYLFATPKWTRRHWSTDIADVAQNQLARQR